MGRKHADAQAIYQQRFPAYAALAEIGWTPREARDLDNFLRVEGPCPALGKGGSAHQDRTLKTTL